MGENGLSLASADFYRQKKGCSHIMFATPNKIPPAFENSEPELFSEMRGQSPTLIGSCLHFLVVIG